MEADQAFQQAYALLKSYVKETFQGGGFSKGKNVIIKSIDKIEGGNRITFSYTLDTGEEKEDYLDVMDGKDGTDGISPVISESASNSNEVYKLEINDINKTFTTPNLKGRDGLSPTITPNLQNDEETYRLDILDANGILTTINLMGKPGQQGIQGQQGRQGEQGIQGIQGIQGKQGDPFLIYKEYVALEDFRPSDFYAVGQMFGVKPSGEGEMYNVYRYAGEGDPPYTFVTSLGTGESIKGEPGKPGEQGVPGEKGEDGTTYTPQIGTVTEGDYAAVSVDVNEEQKIATFNFVIPKGKDGKDGEDGKTYKPVVGTVDTGDEVKVSIDLDEDKYEAKFNFIFPIFGGINKTMFTFQIDQNESNPESMITYRDDAKGMNPAYMDYNLGKFNYGSWGDVWFIKDLKPCMLNYDGTVAYELNKYNYEYKLEGGLYDISNENFPGNAMVGMPKVYWKVVDNGDNTGNVSISDKRIDEDFHCWSHIDANGDEINYCYLPIYNACLVNERLRSLSGKVPVTMISAQQAMAYALANNVNDGKIWNILTYSDYIMITLLLLLIGKSTDSQSVFGSRGKISISNTQGLLTSGVTNNKGLFYGENTLTSCSPDKVFGIENWFGNISKPMVGLILKNGKQFVKMTACSQIDGTTVDGYNFDGMGYLEVPDSIIEGESGGYLSKIIYTKYGFVSKRVNGSSSTYFCDLCNFNNSKLTTAYFGRSLPVNATENTVIGAFCFQLHVAPSEGSGDSGFWSYGGSLSCKPLAKKGV